MVVAPVHEPEEEIQIRGHGSGQSSRSASSVGAFARIAGGGQVDDQPGHGMSDGRRHEGFDCTMESKDKEGVRPAGTHALPTFGRLLLEPALEDLEIALFRLDNVVEEGVD